MNKVTLKIEGMACNMCETHMNETVRKALPQAKKVSSSFRKGETTFLLEGEMNRDELVKAIDATGYVCKDIITEPYEKKGMFGLW